MKNSMLVFLVLLLAGCQATRFHNPEGIAQNQLAYIFKQPHKPFSSKPSAFINAVFDANGSLVMQFKPMQNAIQEAYLKPGEYKFILQCNYGGGATDAEIIAVVEVGKSYRYSCGITPEKVYIGAQILHKSYAIFEEVEI